MTGTRIRIQVTVPSIATVPGGTGSAIGPIPMGCISHPAQQVMAGSCVILPFAIIVRVY